MSRAVEEAVKALECIRDVCAGHPDPDGVLMGIHSVARRGLAQIERAQQEEAKTT